MSARCACRDCAPAFRLVRCTELSREPISPAGKEPIMRISSIAAAASSLGMLLAHSAGAAGTGDTEEALEQVVVTGTRVANRSALETAAPVDVILNDQLQNLGATEIN